MRAKRTIGLLMLTLSLCGNASIQVLHTASEVKSALPAAQPGDTFVLADGNYELSWLKLSCQVTGCSSYPYHPKPVPDVSG